MHKLGFLTVILIASLTLTSCQLAKMGGDAKKNPPDPRLRVKKNLEEGKGVSLSRLGKGLGKTSYEFSTSNPMWRASLEVLDILESDNSFLNQLKSNTKTFRDGMMKLGFDIKPGSHPIVPVMLYDDHLAQKMSSELLDMGIYVIGFFFPVVPKGEARIRVQLSASHSTLQINQALNAFEKIGKKLGVIN